MRVTEERHELPIIAELRQAIMGIRPAIDQALEVGAPMNTCAACERAFSLDARRRSLTLTHQQRRRQERRDAGRAQNRLDVGIGKAKIYMLAIVLFGK